MSNAVRQIIGLILGILFFMGGIILIGSNAVKGGSQLTSTYIGPMLIGLLIGCFGIAILIIVELEDLKELIVETKR